MTDWLRDMRISELRLWKWAAFIGATAWWATGVFVFMRNNPPELNGPGIGDDRIGDLPVAIFLWVAGAVLLWLSWKARAEQRKLQERT